MGTLMARLGLHKKERAYALGWRDIGRRVAQRWHASLAPVACHVCAEACPWQPLGPQSHFCYHSATFLTSFLTM